MSGNSQMLTYFEFDLKIRDETSTSTVERCYVSLELFSAVGGYMGMWLGISLVAVYDFVSTIVGLVKAYMVRRRRQKILPGKNARSFYGAGRKKQHWQSDDFQKKLYDW
ncbi:hypothetical protein AVEN_29256-1 [Araneus ventricosus]|uniref:Uncharacterized protein n=1 Tax=Araneus ventricosus TaxID=182803 RepID=A0A4Y2ISB4_ARAVE|nr:hypothetical protein AVEN_29256-1 [Araneus ventricosus]